MNLSVMSQTPIFTWTKTEFIGLEEEKALTGSNCSFLLTPSRKKRAYQKKSNYEKFVDTR